jgi:hypothetical protein
VGAEVVARSHAEIVEEICVHLRPWKQKRCEADIRSEVEKEIALLVRMAPDIDRLPRIGGDVRRQAATARKTLGRLRIELARAPLQSFIGPHIAISQSVECLDRLDEILANTRLIKAPDPRSKPMQWVCAEGMAAARNRKPAVRGGHGKTKPEFKARHRSHDQIVARVGWHGGARPAAGPGPDRA